MSRSWIPAACGLAMAALLGACSEEPTGTTTEATFALRDYLISNGFEFTSTVDGVRNADVVADSAWSWQDSTVTYLFGVQMDFFDSLGVASARLTSQQARLDAETQDMVATGNATLRVLELNYLIQSPELYYSPESDQIRSDTVTRAQLDGKLLTGTRFVSDLQFRNIEIDSPVGAIPQIRTDTAGAAGGNGARPQLPGREGGPDDEDDGRG